MEHFAQVLFALCYPSTIGFDLLLNTKSILPLSSISLPCFAQYLLTLIHLVQYFFVLVCFFILSFVPLCLCAILLSSVPRSPYHTALQFYSSPWHPCRLYFVHVCHFCVCGHVCARLGVWVCVCVCIWGYECAGNVLISWYPKRCGQSQKADAPLVVKAACHIHHAMKSKVNKLSITLIIKGTRLIINIMIVIMIITLSLTTTQWNQKWMNFPLHCVLSSANGC